MAHCASARQPRGLQQPNCKTGYAVEMKNLYNVTAELPERYEAAVEVAMITAVHLSASAPATAPAPRVPES